MIWYTKLQNPDALRTSDTAVGSLKILSLPYQIKTNVCFTAACFSADMV